MKKHSGFTLVELMITLAIVGILLMVGLPSLKSAMQGNQLVAATNELQSALYLAQSEARKNSARVTVCESAGGVVCTETGDWSAGWIVFHDPLGGLESTGAACTAAGGDCLLRVHDGFTDTQLSISGKMDVTAAGITFITFTSRGLPKATDNTSQSGIFSVCSFDDSNAVIGSRAVVLSLTGRSRVSDNAAVTCPNTP